MDSVESQLRGKWNERREGGTGERLVFCFYGSGVRCLVMPRAAEEEEEEG